MCRFLVVFVSICFAAVSFAQSGICVVQPNGECGESNIGLSLPPFSQPAETPKKPVRRGARGAAQESSSGTVIIHRHWDVGVRYTPPIETEVAAPQAQAEAGQNARNQEATAAKKRHTWEDELFVSPTGRVAVPISPDVAVDAETGQAMPIIRVR